MRRIRIRGRRGKRIGMVLIILVPLGIAFAFVGMEISSLPGFCNTCHFMKPYYRSWKTSSHNEVACVECHIPPGIVSTFRKKYEASAMVVSYLTGTYGTNPWAEVSDESCLRAGCHEKRLLVGKEVFEGILFDHRPHLTELRRGKQLRCTSCHSQIVQGQHITVTTSTCSLCHFKGVALNQGTARCTLCHEVPSQIITTAGLAFDHDDVRQFGMDCTFCHKGVVTGEGDVPTDRCYTCHNEPARLRRYGETEFLHTTHVTEHKVECLNCHQEISHQVPEKLEIIATSCETCHSLGHSPTRDLYLGIGGKGVNPQPSPMYLAGVSCEGCHILPEAAHRVANEVSCMNCHDTGYFAIYKSWKASVDNRLRGVEEEFVHVKGKLDGIGGEVEGLLQEAWKNIDLVERGRGIHNPDYALALLERAHEALNAALTQASVEETLEESWLQVPYEISCNQCHYGIEYIAAETFGRTFEHRPHAVEAGIRCTICHGDLDQHGTLTLESCERCHPGAQAMRAASPTDCLSCHEADIGTVSEIVTFPHERHIGFGLPCQLCHQNVNTLDHLEFARSETAVPELGHEVCSTCHANDLPPQGTNCMKCHTRF
ncbi:MAG: cytochrome c3 family protein [Candidatus Bipolaricaulia bacterium]